MWKEKQQKIRLKERKDLRVLVIEDVLLEFKEDSNIKFDKIILVEVDHLDIRKKDMKEEEDLDQIEDNIKEVMYFI